MDYHQRVPTQIDRFILLKSLLFKKLSFKAEVHSSDLVVGVKHFIQLIFCRSFSPPRPAEALASAVSMDAHYREKNFFGNTKNAFFLKKHAKWTLSNQTQIHP